MARENMDEKGRRLLTEGRLLIGYINEKKIVAVCRGDHDTYQLLYTPSTGWTCSCAARGRCSHLVALQLVTANPITRKTEPVPA